MSGIGHLPAIIHNKSASRGHSTHTRPRLPFLPEPHPAFLGRESFLHSLSCKLSFCWYLQDPLFSQASLQCFSVLTSLLDSLLQWLCNNAWTTSLKTSTAQLGSWATMAIGMSIASFPLRPCGPCSCRLSVLHLSLFQRAVPSPLHCRLPVCPYHSCLHITTGLLTRRAL